MWVGGFFTATLVFRIIDESCLQVNAALENTPVNILWFRRVSPHTRGPRQHNSQKDPTTALCFCSSGLQRVNQERREGDQPTATGEMQHVGEGEKKGGWLGYWSFSTCCHLCASLARWDKSSPYSAGCILSQINKVCVDAWAFQSRHTLPTNPRSVYCFIVYFESI